MRTIVTVLAALAAVLLGAGVADAAPATYNVFRVRASYWSSGGTNN